MDKNRIDLELPCDLEPFGYIESRRIVKTQNAGKLMLVAFGARNYMGHYSPEFGGVALVHLNPDLLIAIKYVPWDAEARDKELKAQYKFLKENHTEMTPPDVTLYFYDDGYTLPAQKKREREEYFAQLAEYNKLRAKELMDFHKRELELQEIATRGAHVAGLNPAMAERDDFESDDEYFEDSMEETLEIVEDQPENDIETVDGEEVIPIDEEEEEDDEC